MILSGFSRGGRGGRFVVHEIERRFIYVNTYTPAATLDVADEEAEAAAGSSPNCNLKAAVHQHLSTRSAGAAVSAGDFPALGR